MGRFGWGEGGVEASEGWVVEGNAARVWIVRGGGVKASAGWVVEGNDARI
jgi:hypothetical protein